MEKENLKAELEAEKELLKQCKEKLLTEMNWIAITNLELQIEQSKKNIKYYKKELKALTSIKL